jgi:hypothetical protein
MPSFTPLLPASTGMETFSIMRMGHLLGFVNRDSAACVTASASG